MLRQVRGDVRALHQAMGPGGVEIIECNSGGGGKGMSRSARTSMMPDSEGKIGR